MLKIISAFVLCFMFLALNAQKPDNTFYTETIHLVSKTVNLVDDYGANGTDTFNDSEALQTAIDDMNNLPKGGKIVIPQGLYIFKGIYLKSNVHLVIDAGTVIKPGSADGEIFDLGLRAPAMENVSIRGKGGRYTIDLTNLEINDGITPFRCGRINNFLISDFNVLDNNTVFSVVRCALDKDQRVSPQNGIVQNGHNENAHIGYGTVQCGAGRNILFRNLSGKGGVTLRLETGSGGLSHLEGSNFDIYGQNIQCENGNAALMVSPHSMHNGYIYIDTVVGISCASAVRIDRGDLRNGTKYGYYDSTSVVKNVTSVYGTTAEIKNGRYWYVPCPLRYLISEDRLPEGKSWQGPSCAAFINTASHAGDGHFSIHIENVQQQGYTHVDKWMLTEEHDRIKNCGSTALQPLQKRKSFRLYPNPASGQLTIENATNAVVSIHNLFGQMVKTFRPDNEVYTISTTELKGAYLVQVNSVHTNRATPIIIQ